MPPNWPRGGAALAAWVSSPGPPAFTVVGVVVRSMWVLALAAATVAAVGVSTGHDTTAITVSLLLVAAAVCGVAYIRQR